MKRRTFFALIALIAAIFATAISVSPTLAGILTIDITGIGSGSLNGSAFTNQTFDFHVVGTENGNPLIDPLNSASVTIGAFPSVDFSGATRVGLSFGPDFAFFGLSSGPIDLIHVTLSPADFTDLTNVNSAFGPASATLSFLNFVDIATSGGPLSFTDSSNAFLSATSTGDVTGAVPELSTWAMMLLGFAGIGFMAYRRTLKASATALG